MTTDPTLAFFRICVWNRREHEADDQLAVAVVPWWCLREGVRVLPLDDIYGRKLARTKLVLRVQLRGDRLTDEEARRRANADERPPQQLGKLVSYGIDVSALVEKNDTQEVSVISMKKSSGDIKEEAGYVRLTVKRKQGDAPCIVFFSTSDGTAHAGADYLPQTGHLFFLRGQRSKDIKILIIDDEKAERACELAVEIYGVETIGALKAKILRDVQAINAEVRAQLTMRASTAETQEFFQKRDPRIARVRSGQEQ